MAWLERRGACYHIVIRAWGRKHKKSLQTDNLVTAQRLRRRVERRWFEQDFESVPEHLKLLEFLLWGRRGRPIELPDELSPVTLGQCCRSYLTDLARTWLAEHTIATERIHLSHVARCLGRSFPMNSLRRLDLLQYVTQRECESGRHGLPVSLATIRQELLSCKRLWAWALQRQLIRRPFPNFPCRSGLVSSSPPFLSVSALEQRLQARTLTVQETRDLWDSVYLTIDEQRELLEHAETRSGVPWLYPLLVLALETGARRSELLRSEPSDFDFAAGTVLIREKCARNRGCALGRVVPMSARLAQVFKNWLAERRGRLTFGTALQPLTGWQAHRQLRQLFAHSRWQSLTGWQVFRRTFICHCASRGVPQRTIDAWVGRTTRELRRRYQHLRPSSD